MRLIRSVTQLAHELEAERRKGRGIALVPTMGSLHAGHSSLLARARRSGRAVVLTIFVNPTQFDDRSDFDRYPRTQDRDLELAEAEGAELVLVPSVEQMYPPPDVVRVTASGPLTELWEGASRPGHFDGVLTVVGRLFGMAGSCQAFFGEKDYQQLRLVSALAAEMFPLVGVVGCPVVREADGLACSSRNALLSSEDRRAAAVIYRALLEGCDRATHDGASAASVEAVVRARIEEEPRAEIDYVGVVRIDDLVPAVELVGEMRILVACRFGPVRLIDNVALSGAAPEAGAGADAGAGKDAGDAVLGRPTAVLSSQDDD